MNRAMQRKRIEEENEPTLVDEVIEEVIVDVKLEPLIDSTVEPTIESDVEPHNPKGIFSKIAGLFRRKK